jgi:hypothetical protein
MLVERALNIVLAKGVTENSVENKIMRNGHIFQRFHDNRQLLGTFSARSFWHIGVMIETQETTGIHCERFPQKIQTEEETPLS